MLKDLKKFLQNPVIFFNVILRVFLVAWILITSRWQYADTYYYIDMTKRISLGFWGGQSEKPPLYQWFLYAFTTFKDQLNTSSEFILPILLQSIFLFSIGFFLWRKTKNFKISYLWLFDPTLLLYGSFIMTDGVFAGFLFLSLLCMLLTIINSEKKSYLKVAAFFCACTALTRSNGVFLLAPTILFFAGYLLKQKRAQELLAFFGILFLCLSPRIYWNIKNFNQIAIASQQESWIRTVAAVVKADAEKQNIDFVTAEHKYLGTSEFYAKSMATHLIENFGSFTKLTVKGMIRVLVGHNNVELGYITTGKSYIGPGWFRPKEKRDGPDVNGSLVIGWSLGILFFALYYCSIYILTLKKSYSVNKALLPLVAVFLLSALLASFMPLVFGDARFRTGVLPFIFSILTLISLNKSPRTNF